MIVCKCWSRAVLEEWFLIESGSVRKQEGSYINLSRKQLAPFQVWTMGRKHNNLLFFYHFIYGENFHPVSFFPIFQYSKLVYFSVTFKWNLLFSCLFLLAHVISSCFFFYPCCINILYNFVCTSFPKGH
jgi:hypothetical protein